MDSDKIPDSGDNANGAQGSAEISSEGSCGKDATTPKIIEPDPSSDGNLNSEGRHLARAKEKRHSRTHSASRRGWKYPNGPPVPQPNQEPLTLEQCLKVTERDLFKRHEYHKTLIAQKEIYIHYLKFLVETSCRLLYPQGPFPRAPALCPTSFGSDFSQFLSDVHYDGNDNIRWIPHRVATPRIDAARNESKEQPEEGIENTKERTKGGNQEHSLAGSTDVKDKETEELMTQRQESHHIQHAHVEGNQDSVHIGLRGRGISQPEHTKKEDDGEEEGITVTLPEITPISPAIPTVDAAASDPEIQGPIPIGSSRRSFVLESYRIGEASRLQGTESKLQGEISVPHRPKSRGISGSVLPIPYQSDQERLWLKYHEMQLHFDAEIDEMDSRIEVLQKHLIRAGGSIDANGVARAGSRANLETTDEKDGKGDASKAKATEIGGAWLRDVRRNIETLREMTSESRPGTSVAVLDASEMSKVTPTAGGTSGGQTLNGLPYEILSAVLGYLPHHTQAALSVTCRLWHQIMTPMVWKNVVLDEQVEDITGRRRAYRELKRMAASSDEGEKGKQNTSVQTFWPIACLTVQTSIPAGTEADKAGSQDTTNKADDVRPDSDRPDSDPPESDPPDDEDWWKRGLPKLTRKTSKTEYADSALTARDKAISYNESLALMPLMMGVLRALGNPKLAMHVRTLYASVCAMPWPIEGGQDMALSGDLIRHLRGLRAQTMRQMLVLIKKAVRNLTRVEDLIVKSRDSKISNALLGILGGSPKLKFLQLMDVDLRACQLSRGRGKGQAYEVLKRIVEESGDTEEVKRGQIKVIDRLHTENGWMHCLSPSAEEEEVVAPATVQGSKGKKSGLQETPPILDVQGNGEHKDVTAPSVHSGGGQKDNALNITMTPMQENEEQPDGAEKPPATISSTQRNGKGRDDAKIATTTLTSSEWRQKLSQESMNSACWNPVEMAAYDAGSIQGSSTGSVTDRPLQLTGRRRQPPARKRHDGSYFYPSLMYLTLQGCEYHGLTTSTTFPNRPKPFPRNAIRATVALRRFLTRCPNLKSLTIRGCTIQAEALLDFGSPRRAVWWKSIFAQTLMETGIYTGGPLFVTEMQSVVEVPFEEVMQGGGQQQQQQLLASPSPSPNIPSEGGDAGSASAESTGAAPGHNPEASSAREETEDKKKQLMAIVWKRLRDNNNRLLTFPNLETLNIDCGTFPRPEVPYHWISSPGFEDFFLRHNKINKLTWDGYILSRHLRLTNSTFLKTTHHLGQTLKTLILNHTDCQNSPPNQIPPSAAHLKAFSFPRLNAFLRALKTLQVVDIFVDLMPTSQILGIARALKGKAITVLGLGRAKGVLGPADVDVLVECLPKLEDLCVGRWRPARFVYGFPVIRIDPPGFGELAYEEDENFPTQEEEGGEEGTWFSVGELATKLSHLPNLITVSLNYTFPIPASPPLPPTPNEIFNILCDDTYHTYHTPSSLVTLSTTPGTPQSVWIREYLNALRTTAEVFASTPELNKLLNVTLGYFVHDSQSRGSVRIFRDGGGRPVRWEGHRFPKFVWKVLDAHEVEVVGGPLGPVEETAVKE